MAERAESGRWTVSTQPLALAVCAAMLWACGEDAAGDASVQADAGAAAADVTTLDGAVDVAGPDDVGVQDAGSGTDTVPDTDAAPDTVTDAVTDAVTDPDTVADAVADAAPDTVSDAAPDTVSDAAPDTVSDTVSDAASDTVAVPDTAPDTAPDTVSDTAAVSDTGPDTTPDTTPDAGPPADAGCAADTVSCEDGNACNGLETCASKTGQCLAGKPLVCDDGNVCTTDACNPNTGCVTTPKAAACSDGDACTVGDACDSGVCKAGKPMKCDDGEACNGEEACDPGSGKCVSSPPPVCDDNKACNGVETCDPGTGKCAPGKPVVCDDNKPCNGLETCDAKTGKCSAGTPIPCDDKNACNGIETCAAKTGQCVPGKPVVCDDGKVCNGVETCDAKTGKCVGQPWPSCAHAPPECGQPGGGQDVKPGTMTTISGSGAFRLQDDGSWAAKGKVLDAIVAHPSVKQVGLAGVLGDLNRTGKSITAIKDVACLAEGFDWNSGDSTVDHWWPQGVTGSWDAHAGGMFQGKRVLMASWYHKPALDSNSPVVGGKKVTKGARLTITDISLKNWIRYRRVLLVDPVMQGGKPALKTVPVHAGGVAWVGSLLYVVDTKHGIRVFDLNRTLRMTIGDLDKIGQDAKTGDWRAFGHRYVVPQVARYTTCAGCCARFGWVSLDRASKPARLLTGEYSAPSSRGRAMAWPIDLATGKLLGKGGLTPASGAWFPGVKKMQGGAVVEGTFWLSSTYNDGGVKTEATLYQAKPGQKVKPHGYPRICEDLSYESGKDLLWSLTEGPGKRHVFAVDRGWLLGKKACQQAQAPCPAAPPECKQAGGFGAASKNKLAPIKQPPGMRLCVDDNSETKAALAALIKQPKIKTAAVAQVMADLNRKAVATTKVSGVKCLHKGFRWNSGDDNVSYWKPQGITASFDAVPNGVVAGKKVLFATWRYVPGAGKVHKGARLSFVDVTGPATPKYRHALLVEPKLLESGQPSFGAVPASAGGIAWVGGKLYVADSSTGLRVFDLDKILQVTTGDSSKIGYVSSKDAWYGYGYKYVVPQVARYRLCPGSCCAIFSFAGLLVGPGSASLLTGEYSKSSVAGRVHRWPLDPKTGDLKLAQGHAKPDGVWWGGVTAMQGGVITGANWWLASSAPKSSSPKADGKLIRTAPGKAHTEMPWADSPQDMMIDDGGDLIWGHNWTAGKRSVFAVKRNSLEAGCK